MLITMIGSTAVIKVQDNEQRKSWDSNVRSIAVGLLGVLQFWFVCSIQYYQREERKKLKLNSTEQVEQSALTPQLRIDSNKQYKYEHSFSGYKNGCKTKKNE